MRTTWETNGIELNTFEQQARLLPIMAMLAIDEGEHERAEEAGFAIAGAKSMQEEGYIEPKAFQLTYDEAVDLAEAISTERMYLEYFISYAKPLVRDARAHANASSDIERVKKDLDAACMDERVREITHLALETMVEAIQGQFNKEDLLLARPRGQF